MKIVLEYEKTNPWDFGPDTLYKVIEIEGLTRKERKSHKPKKVMEILTEVKDTLYNNGRIKSKKNTFISWF